MNKPDVFHLLDYVVYPNQTRFVSSPAFCGVGGEPGVTFSYSDTTLSYLETMLKRENICASCKSAIISRLKILFEEVEKENPNE